MITAIIRDCTSLHFNVDDVAPIISVASYMQTEFTIISAPLLQNQLDFGSFSFMLYGSSYMYTL